MNGATRLVAQIGRAVVADGAGRLAPRTRQLIALYRAALAEETALRRPFLWRTVAAGAGVALYFAAAREPPLTLCVALLCAVCLPRIGRSLCRQRAAADRQVAAHQPLGDRVLGPEGHHQRVEQLARLAFVVRGEVADVDVECDATPLRPGVDRQVRLGQQHCAGNAARLALPLREHVIFLVDDGQAGVERGATTQR